MKYKPEHKGILIFIAICVVGIIILFINPSYTTPIEKFEKYRYQGKYHLAINEFPQAVQVLYKAALIGEEIFLPPEEVIKKMAKTNKIDDSNKKDLFERTKKVRDQFIDSKKLLDVYLNLSFAFYKIEARDRTRDYLKKAENFFPDNPFISMMKAVSWTYKDHNRAREIMSEIVITNFDYAERKQFKIYNMILKEAEKFTNQNAIYKQFGK